MRETGDVTARHGSRATTVSAQLVSVPGASCGEEPALETTAVLMLLPPSAEEKEDGITLE